MCDYMFMSYSSIQISGSSTDSVDSLYKSFYREFSRVSSTTSSKSFDEEDMKHNIFSGNYVPFILQVDIPIRLM